MSVGQAKVCLGRSRSLPSRTRSPPESADAICGTLGQSTTSTAAIAAPFCGCLIFARIRAIPIEALISERLFHVQHVSSADVQQKIQTLYWGDKVLPNSQEPCSSTLLPCRDTSQTQRNTDNAQSQTPSFGREVVSSGFSRIWCRRPVLVDLDPNAHGSLSPIGRWTDKK